MTSLTSFWCLYCYPGIDFIYSDVSIADFEQAITAGWRTRRPLQKLKYTAKWKFTAMCDSLTHVFSMHPFSTPRKISRDRERLH